MKQRILSIITIVVALTFNSCGQEGASSIKGIWKCQLNGVEMTLDFGYRKVEYTCYTELYDATGTYEGTYAISGNDINIEFTSLTKKNSSKIEYTAPVDMPKEAVLKDTNTILYINQTFKRQ